MGNYNPQYRDYYSSMLNKQKVYSVSNNKTKNKVDGNFIVKRITRDLVGVLMLFIFVLSCKIIVTPTTQAVYNYSKKIVNENYDYKKAWNTIKSFDFKNFKYNSKEFIDKVTNKLKIPNDFDIKKEMGKEPQNNYILPCIGDITSEFGERVDPFTGRKQMHKGMDIAAKENTPVKVADDGKVKNCGEDKDFGKYIIVDHGEGFETKYGHLNDIGVKKGQIVKKGEVIGKSGNTGKSTGPHVHFEIMYMGESKDPRKFFSIQ